MTRRDIQLPDILTSHYAPADDYFVFRKPFLLNLALKTRNPEEEFQPESKFERQLSRRQIKDNDVFVGIAGLKSLDMLSIAGSHMRRSYQHAVLYDVNQRQVEAMLEIMELIKQSKTPEEFKEKFVPVYMKHMQRPDMMGVINRLSTAASKARQEEYAKYFTVFGANKSKYQPQTEAELRDYLKKMPADEHSWLQKDNFDAIKKMVEKGKIKVVNLDLRDRTRVAALRDWLAASKLRVGDMYISSTMGFMDPYLKTDYYSKDSGLTKAQDFYTDLLTLVDSKGEFIVSDPDPNQAFMQDYFLHTLTKAQMQDVKDDLPAAEPSPHEKRHDFMFNGGDQVWRVMSFDGRTIPQDTSKPKEEIRYFRVSSELPVTDIEQLTRQLKIVETVIAEMNADLKAQKLPTIIDPRHARIPGLMSGLRGTADYQYYAMQEEQARRAAMGLFRNTRDVLPIHLSSQPFMIRAEEGQDPGDTLKELEKRIRQRLEANVGHGHAQMPHPTVEPKAGMPKVRMPIVTTRPDAIKDSMNRGAGAPGAEHLQKGPTRPGKRGGGGADEMQR